MAVGVGRLALDPLAILSVLCGPKKGILSLKMHDLQEMLPREALAQRLEQVRVYVCVYVFVRVCVCCVLLTACALKVLCLDVRGCYSYSFHGWHVTGCFTGVSHSHLGSAPSMLASPPDHHLDTRLLSLLAMPCSHPLPSLPHPSPPHPSSLYTLTDAHHSCVSSWCRHQRHCGQSLAPGAPAVCAWTRAAQGTRAAGCYCCL